MLSAAINEEEYPYAIAALSFTAFLFGLYGFAPELNTLWNVWSGDPLRSAGILAPPLALWLSIRAWRGQRFEEGS